MPTRKCIRLAAQLLLIAATASAQIEIDSFHSNGELNCRGLAGGSTCAVQWASSMSGPWTNTWNGLARVVADSSGTIRVRVPMFYRVMGLPEHPNGMMQIPHGENSGTNPLAAGESYDDSYPEAYSLSAGDFFMDRYEVTNDEMVKVLNWAYREGNLDMSDSNSVRNAQGDSRELLDLDDEHCGVTWNGNAFDVKPVKGASHPCLEVTWYGACAYCNYRSEKEGWETCYDLGDWSCDFDAKGYRLPREEEWEYAARGGVANKRFPWGEDTISHTQANYYASSEQSYDLSAGGYHPDWETGAFPFTSPVGTFEAGTNAYGLYDMAGNVWEWCWDEWGTNRVGRGGGWYGHARYCRVAVRDQRAPDFSSARLGFRALLYLGQ
jgi:formylglycine-generating enzyme required for sulfatase activity